MTTAMRPLPAKGVKAARRRSASRKSCNGASRGNGARRESKTVAEFNRWVTANAAAVEQWARANTKRLTGKEVL
jgi:hypothetical protein